MSSTGALQAINIDIFLTIIARNLCCVEALQHLMEVRDTKDKKWRICRTPRIQEMCTLLKLFHDLCNLRTKTATVRFCVGIFCHWGIECPYVRHDYLNVGKFYLWVML